MVGPVYGRSCILNADKLFLQHCRTYIEDRYLSVPAAQVLVTLIVHSKRKIEVPYSTWAEEMDLRIKGNPLNLTYFLSMYEDKDHDQNRTPWRVAPDKRWKKWTDVHRSNKPNSDPEAISSKISSLKEDLQRTVEKLNRFGNLAHFHEKVLHVQSAQGSKQLEQLYKVPEELIQTSLLEIVREISSTLVAEVIKRAKEKQGPEETRKESITPTPVKMPWAHKSEKQEQEDKEEAKSQDSEVVYKEGVAPHHSSGTGRSLGSNKESVNNEGSTVPNPVLDGRPRKIEVALVEEQSRPVTRQNYNLEEKRLLEKPPKASMYVHWYKDFPIYQEGSHVYQQIGNYRQYINGMWSLGTMQSWSSYMDVPKENKKEISSLVSSSLSDDSSDSESEGDT